MAVNSPESSPRALSARLQLSPLKIAAVGAACVFVALGAYMVARETSIFAVRTIAIDGGSLRVKAEIQHVLEPEVGRSLLRVSGADVDREIASIPDVVSVRVSRSFPSTLRVIVRPERAVLLLRQGSTSWVVSSLGRVMRQVRNPHRSQLPRLWLTSKSVQVKVGETLPLLEGKLAAAAVAPIAPGSFKGGVRSVGTSSSGLTLVLASGPQIRLGDIGNLRLKLTIAKRILHMAVTGESTTAPAYVDVSVPERPVLGADNSQVGSTG
jgi:cell division protein FtsQ